MTDEVRIRFGDGDPHCLHCVLGDAINAVVTYYQSQGQQVTFLMVLGSLVQIATSMIEQAPEEDREMLAAAVAAKVISLAEKALDKEKLH